jgi:hypothetical protein
MMAHPAVKERIEEFFGYLFKDYNFTVFSETYFESFSNWVIVLLSDSCRIRFLEDRGEVSIAIGPPWSPASWQAGPWFDLLIVIAYLTNGEDIRTYESGNTTQQLEGLGSLFRQYCNQICELFREDVFQKKQGGLREVEEKWQNQLWARLSRKP